MKNLLSERHHITLLSLLLLLILNPFTASASIVGSGKCGDNLTWSYDDATHELRIEGSGDMYDYESSSKVPWYVYRSGIIYLFLPDGLTNIEHHAFFLCSHLASVTIPSSVTVIGNYAFDQCSGLKSVDIPNSVTSIGNYAFYDCYNLTSINIPNSVTSIGGYAFCQCSGLTSVNISNSTTNIGEYAFYRCSGLKSVNIPNSVNSIGSCAFAQCTGLTAITIGNSVTSIDPYTFKNCINLRTITSEVTTPPSITLSVFDGVPVSQGILYVPTSSVDTYKSANQWRKWGQILPIPGIDPILASGTCGDNLTWTLYESGELRIEGSGRMTDFENSTSAPWQEYKSAITKLTLPDGLTSIGDFAFYGCSGLTSVKLPNQITYIGWSAFCYCTGLVSANIPNSVNSTGRFAFSNCPGLREPLYTNRLFVYFPVSYKGYYEIPKGIETICAGAFYNCSGLTSVTIPNSVISIENNAFNACTGLTSITIPNSVTDMGEGAFFGCSRLTSVTIPNSVTRIEDSTFERCSKLTTVTIPNSVTYIGSYAFGYCTALTSVHIPNSVTETNTGVFRGCSALTSINIPNSLTRIESWTFYGCSGLTSITIPKSVTSIGNVAFRDCSNLKEVICENEMPPYTDRAFENVDVANGILYVPGSSIYDYKTADEWKDWGKIQPIPGTESDMASGECGKNVWYKLDMDGLLTIYGTGEMTDYEEYEELPWEAYSEKIKEVRIEEGVKGIGARTFQGHDSIASVYIPSTVVRIGEYAFTNCESLSSIVVSNGNTKFDSRNSCNAIIEKSTGKLLYGCKNTVIPNGVNTIGEKAFYECTGLTSITIPDNVTSIEDYAFSYCTSLESISIPNSVESIGIWAFVNCVNLKDINLPKGLEKIGISFFNGCHSLPKITLPGSVTSIGMFAFRNCYELTELTCEAITPPTLSANVFLNAPVANGILYVPASSVNAYKAADQWKDWGQILPIPGTEVNPTSGTCGKNLTWSYDPETGKLTIEGSGAMTSYNNDVDYPWHVYRENITEVSLPEGLTSIGEYALYRCLNLTSLYIPNSVTSIGRYAISNCIKLTSVNIPNGIRGIAEGTFYFLPKLQSITIPSSVEVISDYGLYDCGYSSVTCLAKNPPSIRNDKSISYGGTLHVLPGCKAAYEADEIWNKFRKIVEDAIDTTTIVMNGWCGENLTWTLYKDGDLRIEGSGAMDTYKDAQSVPWYEYCKSITQLSLPEGLSSIGDFAFNGCSSLTSVILPNSVTSVGFYAFAGCDGLTTPVKNSKLFVYMPASYKGAYDIPNGIETIGKLAFKGCGELTNVNIPATVTSIGSSAFEGCSGLSSISIPATVTEIEMWAFQGCTGLESVTIGNGVAVIGEFAFYGCTRITSITLPQSVTRINSYAFNECNELREMVCKASTPPTVKSSAFGETTLEKGQLYVLGPCVNAYKAADGWKEWRQIRPIPGTEVLFTITAESADKALGTVRGGGMFVEGETVTLTATASEDYRFTAWSDGSTSNPYTFTATRNVTLTASFEQLPPSERKMLELTDDMDYATIPAKKYESLEYIRQSGNAGQWEALSVPMRVDVIQNSQQAEFGEVYAIAPCRDTNGDGKVDEQDEYCVIVKKMDKGELQPNMPYFIRPLNDGGLKLQSVDNQFHAARTRPLSISVVTRIYSFIPQKQARNLNGKDEYVLEDAWLSGGPKAKGMGRPSRWVMSITPENPDKDSLPGEVSLFTLDEDVIETVVNGKRQFILLDDDTETAIDLARQQDSRGIHGVYTLDGRKMPDVQHLQPGIYIVNGKKVSSQHILSR